MDLSDLFDFDRDRRRDGDVDQPREQERRGIRGVFRRWLDAVAQDDEDTRDDRRNRRRDDADFGWD